MKNKNHLIFFFYQKVQIKQNNKNKNPYFIKKKLQKNKKNPYF